VIAQILGEDRIPIEKQDDSIVSSRVEQTFMDTV
jgi:hypothetical protein